MTRRIAAAILLTVWAILIAGGFTAYWATRSVLLADLDRSLVDNAQALSEVSGGHDPSRPPATAWPEDRYVIKNPIGQTVAAPAARAKPPAAGATPRHTASFATVADGRRLRTVTVPITPAASATGGAREPVTVVYSRPTDQLDRVLGRLAFTLAVCGLAAGGAAAAVAVGVARRALRPLHAAADVVGVIDERMLDRRIDETSLPVELRPVASRLNGMLERLQRAFAHRRRFLADASHELRTPVAALVTTLEVSLLRKRDPAELARTLQACLSDARYLKRLVTTLLEHARDESPARGPALEPFDAAELLSQCAATGDALAAGQRVTILRSFEPPMRVVSDCDRLRGVVTNLLANAIEHTRPGGTVELGAKMSAGALELFVRDTGPGVPPEQLPNLFQPFYRADASRKRGAVPHLGLGLFIVESHLRALGGRCDVESEVGVGTTMRVSIPTAPAAHPLESHAAAHGAAAASGSSPSPIFSLSPEPTLLQAGGRAR